MPRFPWIPSKSPELKSAYRPATVAEVLDTGGPDEGYRYRVLYAGQSMEMFCQPGGRLLSVGELVIPRIVRGAAELFLPMPIQTEVLYLGLNKEGAGGELWEYDGTNPPTQLWSLDPVDGRYPQIMSLCWCKATGSLFIGAWDNIYQHVYEWKPGEASPTLRLSYDTYETTTSYDPPIDWAEWKGKLYVMHSGQDEEPGVLCRFDPTDVAGTFEIVLTIMSMDENLGEGALMPFPDRIYAMTSENIYWSTTGDAGSWTELADLPNDHDCHTARGAVVDPVTGHGFFVATGSVVDYNRREVWRLEEDGTLTRELSQLCPDEWDGHAFSQIAIPYGDTDLQPLAIQWQEDNASSIPFDIYRRNAGGGWALEEQLIGPGRGAWVGANQAAVYFKKKLHLLVGDHFGPPYMYHQYLYRRDAVGSWTEAYHWTGYEPGTTYSYGATMTLGRTNKLIHNI